jgi:hypothetical protein
LNGADLSIFWNAETLDSPLNEIHLKRLFEKPKSVLGYTHKGGYGCSRVRDLKVF